jgi:thiamine transport system substrate-binding protein
LKVLVYDSLMAESGLGPALFAAFEKRCGCVVQPLPSGDGGQLLARLALDAERGRPSAHLVLGLDQHLWERSAQWIEPVSPEVLGRLSRLPWAEAVQAELGTGAASRLARGFVPFDYGYFAFILDRVQLEAKKNSAPKKLIDLLEPRFRRSVILQDPRSSAPGRALVLLTVAALGEPQAWDFWRRLRPQWVTLAPGWDAAYGLFLEKQGPLVWSYVTSEAYHFENGDRNGRYFAWIPEEGTVAQVEAAALVRGAFAPNAGAGASAALRKNAEAFLEFLASPEAQALVPRRNWMLPARSDVALPESFRRLPRPTAILRLPAEASPDSVSRGGAPGAGRRGDALLDAWSRAIRGGGL